MGSLNGWKVMWIGLGVKDVVPDDLSTYKPVVDGLGLEYQVYVVHVRKNATRRLRKMKG